jgi:energy-coupling factor transport system ATP-binding protein
LEYAIEIKDLCYSYPDGTLALDNINLNIPAGSKTMILGPNGAGKSTLMLHLNGINKPSHGEIRIMGEKITHGSISKIRSMVGLIFQDPDDQVFSATVYEDVAFGPLNLGLSREEADKRVKRTLDIVKMNEYINKSPLHLSYGQKKRVAIAGVLAMDPDVIVLDEPTAGLDPRGCKEIMDMFYQLHKERNLSTILVSHSMEDAAKYADQIVIMHQGKVVKQGTSEQIFSSPAELIKLGLDVPEVVRFQLKLEERIGAKLDKVFLSIEELSSAVAESFARGVKS